MVHSYLKFLLWLLYKCRRNVYLNIKTLPSDIWFAVKTKHVKRHILALGYSLVALIFQLLFEKGGWILYCNLTTHKSLLPTPFAHISIESRLLFCRFLPFYNRVHWNVLSFCHPNCDTTSHQSDFYINPKCCPVTFWIECSDRIKIVDEIWFYANTHLLHWPLTRNLLSHVKH